MGVCGSGKTTVAKHLATKFDIPFCEADDFHPEENKVKMSSGCPLTDEDRLPWLLSLHDQIDRWISGGISGVITCSALKRLYRDVLTMGQGALSNDQCVQTYENVTKDAVMYIYLKGSYNILKERMSQRKGHFMPDVLLQSQLDILEEPTPDENHLQIDIDQGMESILNLIVKHLVQS